MTPQESRETFIDGILNGKEYDRLREMGAYEDYIEGRISIQDIYDYLKGQAE
jgi:hypothetical protein